MVRVWKTKWLLFCLRYDPLMVFRRKNHITFIFIKTMSHDLLVQMAYWISIQEPFLTPEPFLLFDSATRGIYKFQLSRRWCESEKMSCHAILKNLYEPKMDVIFDHSLQNNSGNRDNKTYVLCPTLQTRTCIGVLKSIIIFFHSLIAMECVFTLFFHC